MNNTLGLPTEARWIGIVEASEAIGEKRLSLDILRSLTRPAMTYRMSRAPRQGSKRMWHLGELTSWLNYHLKLSPLQIDRLVAASHEILPSFKEPQYER